MTRVRAVATVVASMLCQRAIAAETDVPTPVDLAPAGLLQAVAGLALVVALIWIAGWFLRRMQPHAGAHPGLLKVVASHSIGQRERVVIVEIGGQWLVLGVGAGSISSLAQMPRGELPPATSATGTFATLLARARGERPAP